MNENGNPDNVLNGDAHRTEAKNKCYNIGRYLERYAINCPNIAEKRGDEIRNCIALLCEIRLT